MRLLIGFCSVIVCLVLTLASGAHAQSIATDVQIQVTGVPSSDPQGPAEVPELTSFLTAAGSATLDFADTGYGRAVLRQDGVGAVKADALFANGQTGNSVRATASWTQTATNTTSGPLAYEFAYLITPASLRIADYAGLPDALDNAPEASYSVAILVDGVVLFESSATLRGGVLGYTLTETGTSLNPTLVPDPLPPLTREFGYDFDARSDVLALGSVLAGQTITVEYEMVAEVTTPGFEAGGLAVIGDPFDLEGVPGFSGEIVPAGPVSNESATVGQLKAGFGE